MRTSEIDGRNLFEARPQRAKTAGDQLDETFSHKPPLRHEQYGAESVSRSVCGSSQKAGADRLASEVGTTVPIAEYAVARGAHNKPE